MGERKKLTMYYPPDFDPKLVPRTKRDPNFTCEVRMMLPFSVQCDRCGEFMYMGKKFNSKKENAHGEKYMGIQIIRFYIKCGTCSNQMTFKTDPENGDYTMESGGTRTFEIWKEQQAAEASNRKERIDEDKDDAMTALENRTRDSQKAVDMLDALDELKAVSQRNQHIDTNAMLAAAQHRRAQAEADEELEDEKLIKSMKFRRGGGVIRGTSDGSQFFASGGGVDGGEDGDGGEDSFAMEEPEVAAQGKEVTSDAAPRASKKKRAKKKKKMAKLKLQQQRQYEDEGADFGGAGAGGDDSSSSSDGDSDGGQGGKNGGASGPAKVASTEVAVARTASISSSSSTCRCSSSKGTTTQN